MGAGGADVISGAAQAAEAGLQGGMNAFNITNNAKIMNHYYSTITGQNGHFHQMDRIGAMEATASQRGLDRGNNWTNTFKNVAGPAGMAIGGMYQLFSQKGGVQEELAALDTNISVDSAGNKVDPRSAITSTARNSEGSKPFTATNISAPTNVRMGMNPTGASGWPVLQRGNVGVWRDNQGQESFPPNVDRLIGSKALHTEANPAETSLKDQASNLNHFNELPHSEVGLPPAGPAGEVFPTVDTFKDPATQQ